MDSEHLIKDLKLSSVVPARITGEDTRLELGNMDLAMKLHYIKTVHFFDREAAEGLTIQDLKKPMFEWLNLCYPICGRIRRPDDNATGRPFVKCNDSGVRIVEASCGTKTLDEWIMTVDSGDRHRLLVYHQPLLAHDLGFTPLVFLQFTKFKCGGLSVGMSWAHILGDAFSALNCINMWGNIMTKHTIPPPPPFSRNAGVTRSRQLVETSTFPRSIKLSDPLGDNWLTPNRCKMQMHTFRLADVDQLMSNLLLSRDAKNYNEVEPFEVISAIIWKSLAKIRGPSTNDNGENNIEPKIVTVCNKKGEENDMLGNTHQVIGSVEAHHQSVKDADVLELARLIAQKQIVDETSVIESLVMEKENGNVDDFIVYGANLTFVNLEEVDTYGLQLKGRQPVFADLSIEGVGEEGVVIVLPLGREHECGRIVNVILPEDQVQGLKNELRVEWGIV